MSLIPEQSAEFSDDWIEDVRLDIDNSLSEVYEYFAIRQGEPTSESSSCIGDDISVCSIDDEDFDLSRVQERKLEQNVVKQLPNSIQNAPQTTGETQYLTENHNSTNSSNTRELHGETNNQNAQMDTSNAHNDVSNAIPYKKLNR